ncbi:MAG: sensor histidine kinase [Hyphomonadaceae bacterium]
MLGFVALRAGVPQPVVLSAVAFAIAPAAATLLVRRFHGWSGPWTNFAWVGFATAAAAASGGFASPMAAAFLLGPAFARTPRAVAEAAFFAALGYAAAGLLAAGRAPLAQGVLPAMGAALSLAAVGALMAVRRRMRAAPVIVVKNGKSERAAASMRRSEAAERERIAALSHELRTPLTHIIGFADVMRQRLFGPMHDKYGEYAELIHASANNLLVFANRLLDLSRLQAGRYALEKERFDVTLIAEEVVRLSADSAARKAIALKLDAEEPIPVDADVGAMRQILLNLVANAIKFTPEGGVVTVALSRHNGLLRIEVSDTGPGIAAEDRERLVGAFERGAQAAGEEGYGLGLSLVRAFAALHSGVLGFDDAPGGGAVVRVDAPVLAG